MSNSSMIATLDSSPRESFAKADNDRNAHAVVRIAQKAADKENLIVSPGTSTADETVDADLKFSNSGRWDGLPPSAPALTVSIGTPGRMEALRLLILEGKHATAEGRLAAALRTYETAMVTLPEAYKPGLRNKIAKLEAQLDNEEERTPSRPSRKGRDLARFAESEVGLVDLLQIAMHDVNTGTGSDGNSRGRSSLTSSRSVQRSSPLVREVTANERQTPSHEVLGILASGGASSPNSDKKGDDGEKAAEEQQHDADFNSDDKDESSKASIEDDSMTLATKHLQTAEFDPLEFVDERKSVAASGANSGSDNALGNCIGDDQLSRRDKDDCAASFAKENQQRRTANKELSEKLERQVVDILNHTSSNDLTELHGIGARRAQQIVEQRAVAPFTTISDLTRIGMYPKQIERMGKHNMLECLDVFPSKNV